MPSSSAGICRPPLRYRCVTGARVGPGLVTRLSSVPNTSDSAFTVPLRTIRRVAGSRLTTSMPAPGLARISATSAWSAGSEPNC